MKALLFSCLFCTLMPLTAQEVKVEILPAEIQIKTAVLPAPDADKDGAMVYGYNAEGTLVVLRKGSNNLVCIADDPRKDGINVACYSKKLEPFMARGRELNLQGKSSEEREAIREKEVAQGSLKMPDVPSMLYVYYGKS